MKSRTLLKQKLNLLMGLGVIRGIHYCMGIIKKIELARELMVLEVE